MGEAWSFCIRLWQTCLVSNLSLLFLAFLKSGLSTSPPMWTSQTPEHLGIYSNKCSNRNIPTNSDVVLSLIYLPNLDPGPGEVRIPLSRALLNRLCTVWTGIWSSRASSRAADASPQATKVE